MLHNHLILSVSFKQSTLNCWLGIGFINYKYLDIRGLIFNSPHRLKVLAVHLVWPNSILIRLLKQTSHKIKVIVLFSLGKRHNLNMVEPKGCLPVQLANVQFSLFVCSLALALDCHRLTRPVESISSATRHESRTVLSGLDTVPP